MFPLVAQFYSLIKIFSSVDITQKDLKVTEGSKEGVYEVRHCHVRDSTGLGRRLLPQPALCGAWMPFAWRSDFRPRLPAMPLILTLYSVATGSDAEHAGLRHSKEWLLLEAPHAGEGGHRGHDDAGDREEQRQDPQPHRGLAQQVGEYLTPVCFELLQAAFLCAVLGRQHSVQLML